jgi:hypothetical protein
MSRPWRPSFRRTGELLRPELPEPQVDEDFVRLLARSAGAEGTPPVSRYRRAGWAVAVAGLVLGTTMGSSYALDRFASVLTSDQPRHRQAPVQPSVTTGGPSPAVPTLGAPAPTGSRHRVEVAPRLARHAPMSNPLHDHGTPPGPRAADQGRPDRPDESHAESDPGHRPHGRRGHGSANAHQPRSSEHGPPQPPGHSATAPSHEQKQHVSHQRPPPGATDHHPSASNRSAQGPSRPQTIHRAGRTGSPGAG